MIEILFELSQIFQETYFYFWIVKHVRQKSRDY